jgi:hypothetical protein
MEEDEVIVPMDETLVGTEEEDEEDTFEPFDFDGFRPRPTKKVLGADGLPTVVDETQETDVPALSRKTLVCMGDTSSFVVRDAFGEVVKSFLPGSVEKKNNGKYYTTGSESLEVEPIVPPCKYFKRQQVAFAHNARHTAFQRVCTYRRSTGGAFMDLSDTLMAACDMREPRDLESEKALDECEDKKIEQGKEREFLSIFDTERT